MGRTTYVDLFCGGGGLSSGFRQAGWTCLLASDRWDDALATFVRNHPRIPVHSADVRDLDERELARLLPCKPDWIVGGPPCQGFSTIGKRSASDPRNGLVREFHRVVEVVRPPGFLIENVLGLKDMRFVRTIKSIFEELGYSVTALVLTSADYGVPQLRRRVVFVGRLEGARQEHSWWRGPARSHAPKRYVSVWDAIGDLPVVGPGETATEYDRAPTTEFQRRMRRGSSGLQGHRVSAHPPELVRAISFIPDGGNRRSIPDAHQPRSGFHNSYSRLSSSAPAVAVTQNMGKPSATRCIHPFQHRGLTAREGARLQSFPDRYVFEGGVTSQRRQIANAVPPLLARAIARALDNEARWSEDPSPSSEASSREQSARLPDASVLDYVR